GLADLVLSEHNGLLIEPTGQALLAAVHRLVTDEHLRERLGRNAAATARGFRIERGRESWTTLLPTRLLPLPEAAVGRARREPVVALFPAPPAPVLWPLAAELARRGIDVYWVESDGSRQSPHPRLHVLSEKDDLYLLR